VPGGTTGSVYPFFFFHLFFALKKRDACLGGGGGGNFPAIESPPHHPSWRLLRTETITGGEYEGETR